MTGFHGCFSYFGTKELLRMIDKIHPDIIHLHNLHNWTINLPMLFRYIKKHNIAVVWTLHDCWGFTGKCPHFTLARCERWKTGCFDCAQVREYPQCFVDQTKLMWKLKKKWFTGVQNLTIVTPSQWLAKLVRESYLKEYPIKVINNGIDLNVFHPMQSDFRKRNKIADDKYLLLGVAFGWGERKGLDVFIELSKRMSDQYQIVLVGTDSATDAQLPGNVISIHKTQNQKELAEIYSAADLFVNPTREENYPTVNMESIACGIPVLTFRTGGSPEIVDDTCGYVVNCDDVDAMEREIRRIASSRPYTKDQCLVKAKSYDMNLKFEEYVKLYERH
jgi:glycosyltransferase involved in cell wall biosynthesis